MRTRIKVCFIASPEEARMAIAAGADALGLVAHMPSGPGPIPDERIAGIAQQIPPPITAVLLTSRTDAEAIADHVDKTGVPCIQIVNHIDPAEYQALRQRLPGRKFLQVIHVENEAALDLAKVYAGLADALLLDSGRPGAAELGGTGRVHDWAVSARLVASVSVPVFLAGGLNPGNVSQAIRTVRPFGVDVCSGLRPDGRLDAGKLAAFAASVMNT